MIKKEGARYCVYDSTGRKKLGTHKTRKQAERQLAAIEIAKQKRKRGK